MVWQIDFLAVTYVSVFIKLILNVINSPNQPGIVYVDSCSLIYIGYIVHKIVLAVFPSLFLFPVKKKCFCEGSSNALVRESSPYIHTVF